MSTNLFARIFLDPWKVEYHTVGGPFVSVAGSDYRKLVSGSDLQEWQFQFRPVEHEFGFQRFVVLLLEDLRNLQSSQFSQLLEEPLFAIHFPQKGIGAIASWWKDETRLTVLRGSEMAREIVPSLPSDRSHELCLRLRNEAIKSGNAVLRGSRYVFEEPFAFPSFSSAASALGGYSVAGPAHWLDVQGNPPRGL